MAVRNIRCLVTGATGYVGSRLVPRLLASGYRVRALARNPDKLWDVPWRPDVEVVKGDLDDVDSLMNAFDGIDVVYYLVHSMGGASKNFSAAEDRSAKNVVTAAHQAGVRRLVYLGGLHPSGEDLSQHLKSRTSVGQHLLDSGIETIVLQAGVIVGSGSASFEMVRHLTDVLPVMTTPKWVHNKIQPIAIGDVLHYLVEAAAAELPASRNWDIGGPDVLEYGDVMQIYAEAAGLRKRYIVATPFLTPTLASKWVGLVTAIPSGMARPLVESLQSDAIVNDHDIDAVIAPPAAGLTPYRGAVKRALNNASSAKLAATWSDAASMAAPSEPLPSDPSWAGPTLCSDERSAPSTATADELWKVLEAGAIRDRWYLFPLALPARSHGTNRWVVEACEPGTLLRLRSGLRIPGEAWLELTVSAHGSGSRYDQRAHVFPRGLAGRLYWHALRPMHSLALRALAKAVIGRAERQSAN